MDPSKWRGRAALIPIALLVACTGSSGNGGSPSPSQAQLGTESMIVRTGRLVFSGDDGEIHVLSLADGEDRAVTSIPGPQFDPTATGRSSSSGTRAPA